MINRIFSKWDFFRIIRFILGIFILSYGVISGFWIFALFGLIFTLMPVFNIGCCAATGCSAPASKEFVPFEGDDVIFEEVEFKKKS